MFRLRGCNLLNSCITEIKLYTSLILVPFLFIIVSYFTHKTSLKADKEVGGCLGAAFGFAFFDGIHATAGLAWVESWLLPFCRIQSFDRSEQSPDSFLMGINNPKEKGSARPASEAKQDSWTGDRPDGPDGRTDGPDGPETREIA